MKAGACGRDGCGCKVASSPGTYGTPYAAKTDRGAPRCQGTAKAGLNVLQAVTGYQCTRAGRAEPVSLHGWDDARHYCGQHGKR